MTYHPTPPLKALFRFSDGSPFIVDAHGRLAYEPGKAPRLPACGKTEPETTTETCWTPDWFWRVFP